MTEQPTDQPTNTDMKGLRKVTLPKTTGGLAFFFSAKPAELSAVPVLVAAGPAVAAAAARTSRTRQLA